MTARGIQRRLMRWLFAWMVVAVLASMAPAAVTGRVSAIGFQSFIRADDWVPLVIATTSDEPAPHTYDLQVVQSDMDGDEVVYTRAGLTVNPGTQTFRTYFRPETINGGLPASGSDTATDLAKRLRIFLFDPATGKRAVRVGVAGALPQAMETGQLSGPAGQKLILVVGRSPSVIDFVPGRGRISGLAETCFFVQVDPARLPESALAYAAADAVVWTDADTSRLAPAQLRALRQYVQGGGTLAVVQNADFARVSKFEDMLPVKLERSAEWDAQEPLKSLLTPFGSGVPFDSSGRRVDGWRSSHPPYRMAAATPADDTTIVDAWTTWADQRRTPLIARRLFGLGCVAWIAEDISDPALATVDFGWARVWERLMDWRDVDLTLLAAESPASVEAEKVKFAQEASRDVGASFVRGMNLESKTAALISVAFVFFVGYWALAGPGSFLLLASRKKTGLSWFVYGAVALAATVLTILIAQLVLRGGPQVKHVSVVRVRAGGVEPARVLSRFGIYLPKDTTAAVTLPLTADAPPAAITPYGNDPAHMPGDVSPRDSTPYEVAIGADADAKTVELAVPFRSTLKKLQADWSGSVAGGIGGVPRFVDAPAVVDPPLEGRVSNDTGSDLYDVVMVFRDARRARGDRVLALPEWKKGQTFELKSLWQSAEGKLAGLPSGRIGLPLGDKPVRGQWTDVLAWLYDDMRRGMLGGGEKWEDDDAGDHAYRRSLTFASLFARCPPMQNFPKDATRVDIRRRGVRNWDVSAAVAAGAMVVLAKSTGPLPLPLTVDGETPRGDGQTFFQAIVPIDRSLITAADQAADLTID